MRGKTIDMNKLMSQNEMTMAVGNMRTNARGEKLGAGGKVVRETYTSVPDQIKSVPVAQAPVYAPVAVTQPTVTAQPNPAFTSPINKVYQSPVAETVTEPVTVTTDTTTDTSSESKDFNRKNKTN